jgi:hypothetical protein
VTNPLGSLEDDLNKLAAADTTNPQSGTATPTPALTAAGEVLSVLADSSIVGSTIGPTVAGVYTTIAGTITDDVVKALQAIAGALTSNANLAGMNVSDVASALTALQTALQTAQSLVPGSSSAVASALASTTQFATLFGDLLQGAGTVTKASDTLYEMAQQIQAIAGVFSTAAQGNP